MAEDALSNRYWLRRVRALRDQGERELQAVCYVEGIRQVLAAHEGGCRFEAVLIEPRRLRSNVAWQAVNELRSTGTPVVELTASEFGRLSARDNPVGIAAIVQWTPETLTNLVPTDNALYLVTDNVGDAGNLGTLIRTADSLSASGIIVHGGVDPSHPGALRASLGTVFRLPVARARSLDEIFEWTLLHQVRTVATSAKSVQPVWQVDMSRSIALLVGSEGGGLAPETLERCDETVLIPMSGTATSLNVGVAAGIVLYEIQRQRRV